MYYVELITTTVQDIKHLSSKFFQINFDNV